MSNVIEWHVEPHTPSPLSSLDDLIATLLAQRQVAPATHAAFFEPSYERDIHNPHDLHDIDLAVDRLLYAIKKNQRIIVHGDYDADGISSTALLIDTLHQLGANASPYLPHREDDGYGLNFTALADLVKEADVLITVDCGISAVEEVAWCQQQGVDVIIVDHHTIPDETPPARAIVHPAHPGAHYPNPHLCGAGTAWKLSQALLRRKFPKDPDREKWLLDLAALGTVADMVPLVGENRAIATFGLEIARRSSRPGLQALLHDQDSRLVTAETLAFSVIPKLNAAGRLEHPQPALDLLLADNAVRAHDLLGILNRLNQRRQTLTRRIVREAEGHVNGDAVIFAYHPSWPAGIVGLAAGRLSDRFAKPAVVIGSNGRHAVGSARAPAASNILDILRTGEAALTRLGGHAQAAGFSLDHEQVAEFRRQLLQHYPTSAAAESAPAIHRADATLHHDLLARRTVDTLQKFEPFGEGNRRPRFLVKNLPVYELRRVGREQQHVKFTFATDDGPLDGIGFNLVERLAAMKRPAPLDLIGELEENEFRGRTRLQLRVHDAAPAGTVEISTKSQISSASRRTKQTQSTKS